MKEEAQEIKQGAGLQLATMIILSFCAAIVVGVYALISWGG